MFRLKNLLNNVSAKLQSTSGIRPQHNTVPDPLKLYKVFTLTKINPNFKFMKKYLSENEDILWKLGKIYKTNVELQQYLESQKFNAFVIQQMRLLKHPFSLKIDREEGDYYIAHIINYTHLSKSIKIGEEMVKSQDIGSYYVHGKEVKQYAVNIIYEWKIKKTIFHELIITSKKEEELLGSANLEKGAKLIMENMPKIIDFMECTGDRAVLQALKHKEYNNLENISNIGKADTDL